MKLINLFVIGFLFGFLFGEFRTCERTNNKYSFDYGCKVRKQYVH